MVLILFFNLIIPRFQPTCPITGRPGMKVVVRSDTSETPEVRFTPEIRSLADSLGRDPRRIYEWVRNHIRYLPYHGSIRGSRATILDSCGNDIDQASLLLALLRYSRIPSRYVIGRIHLGIEAILHWLGEKEKSDAIEILKSIGARPIWDAETTEVEFNHCWVRAKIPMQYYRGSGSDELGRIWIPLFPALKSHKSASGPDIPQEMGFNPEGFFADWRRLDSLTDPMVFYRDGIIQYLNQNYPDLTYDEILDKKEIVPEEFPILPFTGPAPDSGAAEVALPDSLRNYLLIRIERAGEAVLTRSVLISDVFDCGFLIDYIPATHEDSILVKRYGGIWNVPPYLLSVRPEVVIADTGVAVGAKLSMLEKIDLFLDLYASSGPSIRYPLKTRSGVVFGIGITGINPQLPENHYARLALETRIEELVREIGWTMHGERIAKPRPKLAFPILSISYSGGVPVAIDLLGDGFGCWPIDDLVVPGKDRSDLNPLAGIISAYQLSRTIDGISPLDFFFTAETLRIPIFRITDKNSPLIDSLRQPDSVKALVVELIERFGLVQIPRDSIAIGNLTGTGIWTFNPTTGEGMMILSDQLWARSRIREKIIEITAPGEGALVGTNEPVGCRCRVRAQGSIGWEFEPPPYRIDTILPESLIIYPRSGLQRIVAELRSDTVVVGADTVFITARYNGIEGVEITSPQDSSYTNLDTVGVEGIFYGDSVYLNGETASTSGGRFRISVATSEGVMKIKASLISKEDSKDDSFQDPPLSRLIHIFVDRTKPEPPKNLKIDYGEHYPRSRYEY